MKERKVKIKSCKTCGYTDSEVNFPFQSIQFGRAYYRTQCRICWNKYQIERRAVRDGKESDVVIPIKPATRTWPYPPEQT